jgi:tetratricopeptide (TPR) repeat protein
LYHSSLTNETAHTKIKQQHNNIVMSTVELIETLKSRAAACVLAKQWQSALDIYEDALDAASSVSSSNDRVPQLLLATIFSNMSSCRLNMGDCELAVLDADSAIRLAPKWAKAHGRRALALMELTRFDEAKVSMDMARVLEPNNKEFVDLETRLVASRRRAAVGNFPTSGDGTLHEHIKAPSTGAVLVKDHLEVTAVPVPRIDDPSHIFVTPVLAKLGLPIVIAYAPTSGRLGPNHLAAAFMIDPVTGVAPEQWSRGAVGDVVVFRTDSVAITPTEVVALWDYFTIALDAFREGAPPDFTRDHMLEWQESYNDMALQCGEDDASLREVHFL